MFETFHHAKFGKNRFKRGRDMVIFRFLKMAPAAILKNQKIAISEPQLGRFWRNLARWCNSILLTAPVVKNLKFKNPRWRRLPFWKIEKSPYFLCGLSDFYKIWHSDAVRSSWPFRSLKCKILKIQACGFQHLEKSKIEISWQRFDQSPRNLAWWRNSTLVMLPTVRIL